MLIPLILSVLQAADPVKNPTDSLHDRSQQLIEKLTNTPTDQLLGEIGTDLIHFGLKVLAALLLYIVGAWVIRMVRRAVRRRMERRNRDATLITFTSSFVSIGLTVLLIILTIGTLGINTSSLAALLAAGGVALGMSLSGAVQNFAGGIMLMIFKPFKAGDFISAQGYSGTVKSMNIVSTTLATLDNRTVTIPHGILANGNIDNYSKNPVRRVEWLVDLPYGCACQDVKDAILAILHSEPRILDSGTQDCADPLVALKELKDSSVQFTVRAWVLTPDYWDVYFAVIERIYTELPEKGLPFPFPQLDIHLDSKS